MYLNSTCYLLCTTAHDQWVQAFSPAEVAEQFTTVDQSILAGGKSVTAVRQGVRVHYTAMIPAARAAQEADVGARS